MKASVKWAVLICGAAKADKSDRLAEPELQALALGAVDCRPSFVVYATFSFFLKYARSDGPAGQLQYIYGFLPQRI